MFKSRMFLLSFGSDLQKIFMRHFILKAALTLVYSSITAFCILLLLSIRFTIEGRTLLVILLGPILALLLVIAQNFQLFKVLLIISIFVALSEDYGISLLNLNNYGIVQAKQLITIALLFLTARLPHQRQSITQQHRSRWGCYCLALSRSVHSYTMWILLVLILLTSQQFIAILYLGLITTFTAHLLEALLAEPVAELQNQQTLSAAAINIAIYLSQRAQNNQQYQQNLFSKQDSSLEIQYTTAFDSFVIYQIITSIQRMLYTEKDVQIYYLQQAAKQLISQFFNIKLPHTFQVEDTISTFYCYYNFLFYVVYDLSLRLFNSKEQLDHLIKLNNTFGNILKPQLINQLNFQQKTDNSINFADQTKEKQFQNAEHYNLNINEDGTDLDQQFKIDKDIDFQVKNFKDIKINKFTVFKALILRQITLDDILYGTQKEKLIMIEEQRQLLKQRNQIKRNRLILNILSFKWGRQLMNGIQSNYEDVQVLRVSINLFVDLLEKMQNSDGFLCVKQTTVDYFKILQKSGADKRIAEITATVQVAQGCLSYK